MPIKQNSQPTFELGAIVRARRLVRPHHDGRPGSALPAQAVYTSSTSSGQYLFAPTIHTELSNNDDMLSRPSPSVPVSVPGDVAFSTVCAFTPTGSWSSALRSRVERATGLQFNTSGQFGAPDYVFGALVDQWNPRAGGDVFFGRVETTSLSEWFELSPFGRTPGVTASSSPVSRWQLPLPIRWHTLGQRSLRRCRTRKCWLSRALRRQLRTKHGFQYREQQHRG